MRDHWKPKTWINTNLWHSKLGEEVMAHPNEWCFWHPQSNYLWRYDPRYPHQIDAARYR